jgi:hypothetical protein
VARVLGNGRVNVEDDSRSGLPPQSDLCESVRALFEESPVITYNRTCQELRIAKIACLRVLLEHFWFRECYFWWVPHLMMGNEAYCRITFSEELHQVVPQPRETSIDNLSIGDDSLFHYDCAYDSAWVSSRATHPARTSRKIQAKSVWFPLFGRRPVSTVFFHCLLGCGTIQSSFARLFFPTSKGTDARRLAETPIKASTCILTRHEVTMPYRRNKKLPEPQPRTFSIQPILQIMHPASSSCLVI